MEQRLALTVFMVTNTSASATVAGSLPYEVVQANKSTDEAVIEFAQAAGQKFATHQTITLTGTLTLDHSSEPKIPISIVGPAAGLTISGGGSNSDFSVITITSNTQQAAIKGDSASGPITITNGWLSKSTESGAGIDDLGDLVLENVAITNNTSVGSGGGIEVSGGPNIFSSNPGAALLAADTTFTGNTAAAAGGAVDMEGSGALIVNSTFSGNDAGTTGGAINNGPMLPFVSFVSPLNLGVVNSTISHNSATKDGGGIDNNNGGILGLLNSIIGGNTVAAQGGVRDFDSGGTNGIYPGSSHDVIGSSAGLAGSGINDGSNGNSVGHPALMAPLGNYGGATASGSLVTASGDLQTIALLPGSPAINQAFKLASTTASVSSTATTIQAGTQLPLPSLDGSTFPYEQGKVILIGNEQMLVTGVSGSAANGYTLTVTRGVNGTKAAAHNQGAEIFLPDERGVFAGSNSIGAFQTKGFSVTPKPGDNPQSAAVSTTFDNPLEVTIKANDPNAPVNGGVLTYSDPTKGASAKLNHNTATISNGAASVLATANATTGTYTVTVAAGYGGGTHFTLTNTAPTTISAKPVTISAVEGAKFTGTVATFIDSNSKENVVGDFTATINWGDGLTDTAKITTVSGADVLTFAATGSHIYAEEGSHSVIVTISDAAGAKATPTSAALIADAPLKATAVTITATKGTSFSGTVAKFTDGDPAGTLTDYSASIRWGDGTTTTGKITTVSAGVFAVTGSHSYAVTGTESIVVTITDSGGSKATANSKAVVGPITTAILAAKDAVFAQI